MIASSICETLKPAILDTAWVKSQKHWVRYLQQKRWWEQVRSICIIKSKMVKIDMMYESKDIWYKEVTDNTLLTSNESPHKYPDFSVINKLWYSFFTLIYVKNGSPGDLRNYSTNFITGLLNYWSVSIRVRKITC